MRLVSRQASDQRIFLFPVCGTVTEGKMGITYKKYHKRALPRA